MKSPSLRTGYIPKDVDEFFMLEALKEAERAYENKEVPVGAVLVYENEVIARGHNQMEMLQDATAHAEMICITSGSSALHSWRLEGATLYITLEPCLMCAGAIFLSRLPRVVWGAHDLRHGANGSWINVFSQKHPMSQVEIKGGVLEPFCAHLMRDFFQKRREQCE